MVKILNCYLYAKKSYGTLSKGAIFLAIPVYIYIKIYVYYKQNTLKNKTCSVKCSISNSLRRLEKYLLLAKRL